MLSLNFLNKIRLRTRLLLALAVTIVPLMALALLAAFTQNRAIGFGNKEISGLIFNRALFRVMVASSDRGTDAGQLRALRQAMDAVSEQVGAKLIARADWQ